MEDDILSHGVQLPESVQVGDLVIFGDAGGYERSMSYEFGRG
jgi:diaminopimelate decarboxylase